jgi:hypothetical protein
MSNNTEDFKKEEELEAKAIKSRTLIRRGVLITIVLIVWGAVWVRTIPPTKLEIQQQIEMQLREHPVSRAAEINATEGIINNSGGAINSNAPPAASQTDAPSVIIASPDINSPDINSPDINSPDINSPDINSPGVAAADDNSRAAGGAEAKTTAADKKK